MRNPAWLFEGRPWPQLLRRTRRESAMWLRIAIETSKGTHPVIAPVDQEDGRLDLGEVLCVVVRQANRLPARLDELW